MPRISHEQKEFYKSKIRSLLVVDHQMSIREIHKQLHANGVSIDRKYAGRLVGEIHRERIARMDRKMLNAALSTFEDVMTETTRLAWQVALDQKTWNRDKISALSEIRNAHKDVFNMLFDAGVFERKLGTLEATIRNTPLPDERKQAIRSVFENWGLMAPKEDVKPAEPNPNP